MHGSVYMLPVQVLARRYFIYRWWLLSLRKIKGFHVSKNNTYGGTEADIHDPFHCICYCYCNNGSDSPEARGRPLGLPMAMFSEDDLPVNADTSMVCASCQLTSSCLVSDSFVQEASTTEITAIIKDREKKFFMHVVLVKIKCAIKKLE